MHSVTYHETLKNPSEDTISISMKSALTTGIYSNDSQACPVLCTGKGTVYAHRYLISRLSLQVVYL
jgi:hypothetical protein